MTAAEDRCGVCGWEDVALPGMPFRRCPACLSPLDLSQPHEDDCRLRAVLGDF